MSIELRESVRVQAVFRAGQIVRNPKLINALRDAGIAFVPVAEPPIEPDLSRGRSRNERK